MIGHNFLVINLGLRSIRAILFDSNGNKLASESRQLETAVFGEKVEQDPEQWWDLTAELIQSVQGKVSNEQTGYLTVTSSSCNLVCTDKVGLPTHPSLLVSDKRSKSEAEWLAANEKFEEVFTENNFSASPSYIPPKILWLKRNKPDVYAESEMFGSSNSYITSQFVGRHITDTLDAEKFYYDRVEGYSDTILDYLDLTTANLPDVVPVGTDVGPINDNVAEELELPTDTRFIVTTYDALAAFWGSGATQEGDAANVCGTCSSLRVYVGSNNNINIEDSTIKAQKFERPDVTVVGGSNSLEGGLLEWAKSTLYTDSNLDEDALFKKMEEDASKKPIGANGLTFLPYLLGERAPFDDPDARGMFFGLAREHDREDMMRSIFESIGFLTRHMIESIEESGIKVNRINIAGGLTRRKLACQIKADVTGKPVVLVDELENTALGCMIIMLDAVQPEKNIETLSETIVDESRIFKPDQHNHNLYSKKYSMFRDLYEKNKDLFKSRAENIKNGQVESEQESRNL